MDTLLILLAAAGDAAVIAALVIICRFYGRLIRLETIIERALGEPHGKETKT